MANPDKIVQKRIYERDEPKLLFSVAMVGSSQHEFFSWYIDWAYRELSKMDVNNPDRLKAAVWLRTALSKATVEMSE